jgi:hypothetical protein
MRWTWASVCAVTVLGCSGASTAAPVSTSTSGEIHPLEAPTAVAEVLPSAPAALVPVSPHAAEVVAFAWSRDSRFVASFDRDGFFAMTDRDGRVHLHTQVHAGSSHLSGRIWLDDATRHAVFADELSFVVIDLATGAVVLDERAESFGGHRHVAFDASRARIAWIPRRREAPHTLELVALRTGARASSPVDRVSGLRLHFDVDELLLARGEEIEARDAVTGQPVPTSDETRVDDWPPTPSLREGVPSPDGSRTAIVTDGGWALRGADGATLAQFENGRVVSSPYHPAALPGGAGLVVPVNEGLSVIPRSGAPRLCREMAAGARLVGERGDLARDDDESDEGAGTRVCDVATGTTTHVAGRLLDADASGVLMGAADEGVYQAWLAPTAADERAAVVRLRMRGPACTSRRREFAGCERVMGELGGERVLLRAGANVEVFDRGSGRSIARRDLGEAEAWLVADGGAVLVSGDETVRLLSLDSSSVAVLQQHERGVLPALSISSRRDRFTIDHQLRRASDGEIVATLATDGGSVDFGDDGTSVYVYRDGAYQVYDATDGHLVGSFDAHEAEGAAFTADHRSLVHCRGRELERITLGSAADERVAQIVGACEPGESVAFLDEAMGLLETRVQNRLARVVRLEPAAWVRVQLFRTTEGAVHASFETDDSFEVPAALAGEVRFRPAGPALEAPLEAVEGHARGATDLFARVLR